MRRTIEALKVVLTLVLIDGNYHPIITSTRIKKLLKEIVKY